MSIFISLLDTFTSTGSVRTELWTCLRRQVEYKQGGEIIFFRARDVRTRDVL